jgi:hypothetical protein
MIWQLPLGNYEISFNEDINKNTFRDIYSKYANNTRF